jgi:hypothetical protein
MAESLLGALEDLGDEVDSVNHLKLKDLDNGTHYRQFVSCQRRLSGDLIFAESAGAKNLT